MTMIESKYSVVSVTAFEVTLEEIKKKYGITADYIVTGTSKKSFIDPWSEQEITFKLTDLTLYINIPGFQIEGYDYIGCIKDEFMAGLFTVHGNKIAEEKGITISEFVKSFKEIPCSHCGRNHKRVIGHIFRETVSGDLKIFGSGCSKKYFGINFLSLLSKHERIMGSLNDFVEEGFRGFSANSVSFRSVCAIAYYLISSQGYLSRSADVDGYTSTPYLTGEIYFDKNLPKETRKAIHEVYQSVDFDKILEFDFINGKDKDNDNLTDFEHNMLTMQKKIEHNLIVKKDIGFLAYMVYAVFFKQPKKEKKVWNESPDFNKGDKIKDLDLTLIHVSGYEGFYGWMNIYVFEGPNNTQFKWFSGVDIVDLNENWQGKQVHVKSGTVKEIDHHEHFGTAVVLTRCRMA